MPTIDGNMRKFLRRRSQKHDQHRAQTRLLGSLKMALSERLNTPISTAELERRWKAVRAAMEREKIDVLLMQNNNDHMGGYVRYFTDMPATNGYPNTVVFPRDDEMTVVCQGPFGGSETTAQGDINWRGVKQIMTTPSYASAHYTKDYDPELAATRARAVRQRAPSAMSAPTRCRSRCSTSSSARFRRRASSTPPTWSTDQGHQERGGNGAGQARGADAGRRHARRLRGGQARHARHRSGRGRAALQRVARQRERHLSLRLDAARQRRRNSATAICRTASSRKATRSRCWSRITGRAACTPSSAAPASSAPRCRRR